MTLIGEQPFFWRAATYPLMPVAVDSSLYDDEEHMFECSMPPLAHGGSSVSANAACLILVTTNAPNDIILTSSL